MQPAPHKSVKRLTVTAAAKVMNTSRASIHKARRVGEASEQLEKAIMNGTIALHPAYLARHKPDWLIEQALEAVKKEGNRKAFKRTIQMYDTLVASSSHEEAMRLTTVRVPVEASQAITLIANQLRANSANEGGKVRNADVATMLIEAGIKHFLDEQPSSKKTTTRLVEILNELEQYRNN